MTQPGESERIQLVDKNWVLMLTINVLSAQLGPGGVIELETHT